MKRKFRKVTYRVVNTMAGTSHWAFDPKINEVLHFRDSTRWRVYALNHELAEAKAVTIPPGALGDEGAIE